MKTHQTFSMMACLVSGFLPACAVFSQEKLAATARQELACNEVTLNDVSFHAWAKKVNGCGKEDVYVWTVGDKYLSPLPCASFDLGCSQNELKKATCLDGSTVGVSGCGKQATYLYSGSEWLMNSSKG